MIAKSLGGIVVEARIETRLRLSFIELRFRGSCFDTSVVTVKR